mgnify:CR=1 FL=1
MFKGLRALVRGGVDRLDDVRMVCRLDASDICFSDSGASHFRPFATNDDRYFITGMNHSMAEEIANLLAILCDVDVRLARVEEHFLLYIFTTKK